MVHQQGKRALANWVNHISFLEFALQHLWDEAEERKGVCAGGAGRWLGDILRRTPYTSPQSDIVPSLRFL